MDKKQLKTPLISELQTLAQRTEASFYAPGHKKGQGINQKLQDLMGSKVFRADLPELPELDNLFSPEGVIQEAQNLAAKAFGAEKTWFLANGSTSGIIASILAICGEGDRLILPRNVHQSAIFGLVLSGATPIFIEPEYNQEFDLCHNISVTQIADALASHEGVKGVLLVSPTYHGVAADLPEIVHLAHQYNLPIVVDEAHGGHFSFHPHLPLSALEAGADVVIQSTHKVLGAMTQASMLHLQGNLVQAQRISQALQMVQSSSPNYLLLASLDGARQQMAIKGKALLEKTLSLAMQAREQLSNLDYLLILDLNHESPSFVDLDYTRLTVNVSQLGISGYEADEIFNEQLGVTCELPSLQNMTFIISIGNTQEDIEALVKAFQKLKNFSQSSSWSHFSLPSLPASILKLTPRQAFWAEKKVVSTDFAVNQISGETICPYPPGIPIIMAGEVITEEALNYLKEVINLGGTVTGLSDETLVSLQVIV